MQRRHLSSASALLSIASLCLLSSTSPGQAQPPLLKVADFETGDITQLNTQKAQSDSITIVESSVRSGKFAAKTLLRVTDPEVSKGQRAEFSDGPRLTRIEMGKAYWYGLSIFVPEEFRANPKSDAILFQWHTQQGGPSPVLAIRIRKDQWRITGNAIATERRRNLVELPLIKGRWVDWVIHAKWSAQNDGFWTIWQDGVKVVEEKNIITQYPEALGPYAKFGQYHSVSEEAPQNVAYFDEYRVAGPEGSYEQVAPNGKTPQ